MTHEAYILTIFNLYNLGNDLHPFTGLNNMISL